MNILQGLGSRPNAGRVFFRKKIKITFKKYFFLHISSSYAKILGEKLFNTWEIRRSGSKVEGGERKREREKERERKLVITMAKLCMAHAWRTQVAWANKFFVYLVAKLSSSWQLQLIWN